MGKKKYNPLADLNEDVRLLILAHCDFPDALSLMRITKAWYLCYENPRIWNQIYFNTFAEFNPKPAGNVSNWLDEIKKKIRIYGINFNDYRYLLGNVKIRWQLEKYIEVRRGTHIHNTLGIYIDGHLLPFMGYFGPQDVCFNDWINSVFKPMFQKFDSENDGLATNEFRWDFCDQGMPEFVFLKEGPVCRLSIAEGLCGGKAHPDWQRIPFLIEDFRVEVVRFLEEFHRELITKYGDNTWEYWRGLEGVQMSKDGTFLGFAGSKYISSDLPSDNWIEDDLHIRTIRPFTIDNVPKDKHVFFESSDSESSEREKTDQSASDEKKEKKNSNKNTKKRKYKASDSSSSEEKPKKKKR